MKNLLERTIAVGLLAFGIGVVHADISARHGGQFPNLTAPVAEASSNVRFLAEPRKSTTMLRVKHKGRVKTVDLKAGSFVGGTNLTAMSDSMQTSSYVGAGRRIRNIQVANAR